MSVDYFIIKWYSVRRSDPTGPHNMAAPRHRRQVTGHSLRA